MRILRQASTEARPRHPHAFHSTRTRFTRARTVPCQRRKGTRGANWGPCRSAPLAAVAQAGGGAPKRSEGLMRLTQIRFSSVSARVVAGPERVRFSNELCKFAALPQVP